MFSGPGREADDVIEDTLARAKGITILMVSSDRRLIRAAREAKAEQLGNGAFLKALAADTRDQDHPERPAFATDVPLNSASIAHWMREFGFDPRLAAEAEAEASGPVAGEDGPGQPTSPKPAAATPPPAKPTDPIPRPAASSAKTNAAAPDRLGEKLNVELPKPTQAIERARPPSPPPVPKAPMTEAEHDALDPILAEAFEEWRGKLDPDDLDMDRWIEGVTPL